MIDLIQMTFAERKPAKRRKKIEKEAKSQKSARREYRVSRFHTIQPKCKYLDTSTNHPGHV